MTMIAEYYARVGIDVDKKSYESVDRQLSKIESRVESFKRTVSKNSKIDVKFNLNTKGFSTKVREALKNISHSSMSNLRLRNFTVDSKAVSSALQQAVRDTAERTRHLTFQTRLDRTSLKTARNTVMDMLRDVKIRPILDTSSIGKIDMLHGLDSISERLNGVQKRVAEFQRRIQHMIRFKVNFTFDQDLFARTMRVAMSKASKSKAMQLDLTNIGVDSKELVKRINSGLKAQASAQQGIKLDAELSKSALNNIKQQIKNSLKDVKIDIKAGQFLGMDNAAQQAAERTRQRTHPLKGVKDPYPSNVKRTDPTSRRVMSPYYNPMMVGGSLGAFMRFGVHALPFYAGVLGIGALTSSMRERSKREQQLTGYGLMFSPEIPVDLSRDFLEKLSVHLGMPLADLQSELLPFLKGLQGNEVEKWSHFLFQEIARIMRGTGQEEGLGEELQAIIELFSDPKEAAKAYSKIPESRVGELPMVVRELAATLEMTPKQMFKSIESGTLHINTVVDRLYEHLKGAGDLSMEIIAQSPDLAKGRADAEASLSLGKSLDRASGSLTEFYESVRKLMEVFNGDGENLGIVFSSLLKASTSLVNVITRGAEGLAPKVNDIFNSIDTFIEAFDIVAESSRDLAKRLGLIKEDIKEEKKELKDPRKIGTTEGFALATKEGAEMIAALMSGKEGSYTEDYLPSSRALKDAINILEERMFEANIDLGEEEYAKELERVYSLRLALEEEMLKKQGWVYNLPRFGGVPHFSRDGMTVFDPMKGQTYQEFKESQPKGTSIIHVDNLRDMWSWADKYFLSPDSPFYVSDRHKEGQVEVAKTELAEESLRSRDREFKALAERLGGFREAIDFLSSGLTSFKEWEEFRDAEFLSAQAKELVQSVISAKDAYDSASMIVQDIYKREKPPINNTFDMKLEVKVEESNLEGFAREAERQLSSFVDSVVANVIEAQQLSN